MKRYVKHFFNVTNDQLLHLQASVDRINDRLDRVNDLLDEIAPPPVVSSSSGGLNSSLAGSSSVSASSETDSVSD